jgi:hypothetical protein
MVELEGPAVHPALRLSSLVHPNNLWNAGRGGRMSRSSREIPMRMLITMILVLAPVILLRVRADGPAGEF